MEKLPPPKDERRSALRIELTIAIGYVRDRAAGVERWEARLGTFGLLVVGGIAALLLLLIVVPRFLEAVGRP